MKRRRSILRGTAYAVLFAALTACAAIEHKKQTFHTPGTEVHVYVSSDFNDDDCAAILSGVDKVAYALGENVKWCIARCVNEFNPPALQDRPYQNVCVVNYKMASSKEKWIIDWEQKNLVNRPLLGLTKFNSDMNIVEMWIVNDRMRSRRMREIIAAHELGHALNIEHSEEKHSLMSPVYNIETRCITESNVESFCDSHDCTYDTQEVCVD